MRRIIIEQSYRIVFLAVLLSYCIVCVGQSNIKDQQLVLKNSRIALYFHEIDKVPQIQSIKNQTTGESLNIKKDGFTIELAVGQHLDDSNFLYSGSNNKSEGQEQVLKLFFKHKKLDVDLTITYTLGNSDFFVRRKLEINSAQPIEVLEAKVWKLEFDGNCIFQEEEGPTYPHPVWGFGRNKGFGQPVFFENSFWGLEYPAGYNQYRDGTLTLCHFPGRKFESKYTSKTAVAGFTCQGEVINGFQEYLSSIMAIPLESRPLLINYNTWETLMPPTEKNSLNMIELIKEKLIDVYGVRFDTYTFDDGWDDKKTLWDIREDRFPNKFQAVYQKLHQDGINIGLWLSPSSGYDHGPWLVEKGYPQNGTRDKFVCQSDPDYLKDLSGKISDLVNDYDIRFFKFDGICVNCDAVDHSHHLPGDYSKEANVDALIELLETIEKITPEIYIDLTCGIWLSPWWLQYASSLWAELYDGAPEPIVPTPYKGYGRITTRDALIFKRSIENPGFPMYAMENLGVFTPQAETLYDEVMAVMGRGSRLLTFYLNPYELLRNKKDWNFLANAIKWVQENEDVLINTSLISGNPINHEVYGYAHFNQDQGIITLYNPFIEPQQFDFPLNGISGWGDKIKGGHEGKDFNIRVVYPYQQIIKTNIDYTDTARFYLEGHEMLIVHIEPKNVEPKLFGGRFEFLGVENNKANYNVYGEPGSDVCYSSLGDSFNNTIRDNIKVRFSGQKDSIKISDQKIDTVYADNEGYCMKGKCSIYVPKNMSATMHLLFTPVVPSGYEPGFKVRINGKEAEYTTNFAPLETPHIRVFEELPISDWNYFNVQIPAGENEVEFIIDTPLNDIENFKASLGCWLWTEQELSKKKITVEYKNFPDKMDLKNYPLPVSNTSKRQVKTILPLKFYTKSKPCSGTLLNKVYLDKILPDEVAMSKAELGVNRSADGSSLMIGSLKYQHGIGMHSYGRVKYDIKGMGFTKFTSWIGADEKAGEGNLEFEVWVDDIRQFSSGLINKKTKATQVETDISNACTLELRLLGGGDGIERDFGNWGDAQLIR